MQCSAAEVLHVLTNAMDEEPPTNIEFSGCSNISRPNYVVHSSSSSSSSSASSRRIPPLTDAARELAPEYSPLRPLSNGVSFGEMYQYLLKTKSLIKPIDTNAEVPTSSVPQSLSSSRYHDATTGSIDSQREVLNRYGVDISIEDLFIQDAGSTIQAIIDQLATEWSELDERVVWTDGRMKKTKKRKQSSRIPHEARTSSQIRIPMPHGLDIHHVDDTNPLDLQHREVPPEIHDEYFISLLDILKRVPCVADIEDDFGHSTLETVNIFQRNQSKGSNNNVMNVDDREGYSRPEKFKLGNVYLSNRKPVEKPVPLVIPEHDLIDPNELVYSIAIKTPTPDGLKLWKIIDCLGSQSLLDLTNAIQCVNDYQHVDDDTAAMRDDVNSNQIHEDENDGNSYHRDSYYLIENEAYVEHDSPDPYALAELLYNRRCKQIIQSNQFKPFGKKQDTKVEEVAEIPIKAQNQAVLNEIFMEIGRAYLYGHGKDGLCQHVIHFSDVHIFHEYLDLQEKSRYPRLQFQSRQLKRSCDICQFSAASYIVFGDRLCCENPTLFCDQCHHMLHYSPQGDLLYDDFKIFDYKTDLISKV